MYGLRQNVVVVGKELPLSAAQYPGRSLMSATSRRKPEITRIFSRLYRVSVLQITELNQKSRAFSVACIEYLCCKLRN